MERNSLRHAFDAVEEAVAKFREGKIPPDSRPASGCTVQDHVCRASGRPFGPYPGKGLLPLDKLHEHIQTAMGWTNSTCTSS